MTANGFEQREVTDSSLVYFLGNMALFSSVPGGATAHGLRLMAAARVLPQEQGQGSWTSALHLLDSPDGDQNGAFTRGGKAGSAMPLSPVEPSGHQGGFPRAPENSLPFLTISSPHTAAGTPASLGRSSPAPRAVVPGFPLPLLHR